jgi:hypothetical protein
MWNYRTMGNGTSKVSYLFWFIFRIRIRFSVALI